MKTEVIDFTGSRIDDLRREINSYSDLFKCEVISISLTENHGTFYALVVFQHG